MIICLWQFFVLGLMLLIMYRYLLKIMYIAEPKYFGFMSYVHLHACRMHIADVCVFLFVFSAVLANQRVHLKYVTCS